MDFSAFQRAAEETELQSSHDHVSFTLHGLVGEVGVLTAEYKKHLRDRSAFEYFKERAFEELGDLLWYSASLATSLELDLDSIASANLRKVRARWSPSAEHREDFDAGAPEDQSFPRRFVVDFSTNGRIVQIHDEHGQQVGNDLDDNSADDDGYRYHDIFHLANAAVLGWSPVLRSLLGLKRKYSEAIDSAEDGARAIFTEEGVVAVIFRHAEKHGFFEGMQHVESELLSFVNIGVAGLEVGRRPAADWEAAILQGFEVFRQLKTAGSGRVRCDLDLASISMMRE